MANSPSARKRIRQTNLRTARHVARRSRARGYVRIFEEALYATIGKSASDTGGKANAKVKVKDKVKDKAKDEASIAQSPLSLEEHFRTAMSELSRAAQKGALHRKAVSRKISRLARNLTRQRAGVLTPKPEGKASQKASQKANRARASAKAKSK